MKAAVADSWGYHITLSLHLQVLNYRRLPAGHTLAPTFLPQSPPPINAGHLPRTRCGHPSPTGCHLRTLKGQGLGLRHHRVDSRRGEEGCEEGGHHGNACRRWGCAGTLHCQQERGWNCALQNPKEAEKLSELLGIFPQTKLVAGYKGVIPTSAPSPLLSSFSG